MAHTTLVESKAIYEAPRNLERILPKLGSLLSVSGFNNAAAFHPKQESHEIADVFVVFGDLDDRLYRLLKHTR